MKKKNVRIKEEFEQNERKKNMNKLIGSVILIFSIFMLYIMFNVEYFIVNNSKFNVISYKLYYLLGLVFGDMLLILLISLMCISVFYFRNKTISIKKSLTFIAFFIVTSSYLTISKIEKLSVNDIYEAGRNLFEFAFDGKGAGLFGAVVSIPLYKLNKNSLYINFLLIISILLLICLVYNLLRNAYLIISTTLKYRFSEEYKTKVNLINNKRKYIEDKRIKEQLEKEERMKNIFVDRNRQKLDEELLKKPKLNPNDKQEYYSKEELEKKRIQWEKYVRELENNKNNIDQKNREKELDLEVEEFKKESKPLILNDYENVRIVNPIKEEKVEEVVKEKEVKEIVKKDVPLFINQNKEEKVEEEKIIVSEDNHTQDLNILNREELKKSIEEVFTYKKMDEGEKERMLENINNNIEILENTLNAYGVNAKVVDYKTGPTLTRYEITIPSGTRVKKVTSLENELCMNLSAQSIRFEAPIPGKSTIGIETPNDLKETVYFSNLIHSKKLDEGSLSVVLGKDIVGREMIIDIAKMPHLLIAGQTGSGKSVAINTILATLISKKMPDEVKFILIDPKMVELMPYNDIPHLLVPVIIEPKQAAIALKWAEVEMDERYKKLSKSGVRKMEDYNQKFPHDKLPYIVIIIDELADLMMVSASSVEVSIARIAQKARAVGIHLIVATQRPSTDVITGMIKANLPSRISFALRSQIDSRTILDQMGAEKLLGKGDMLLLQNGSSKLERVQGAFISDDEVYQLTEVLKRSYTPSYNMDILEPKETVENAIDPLYENALEFIKNLDDNRVSINILQTNLKLGWNRAKNLFNMLKDNGILDENGYKN